jgi:transposase InsO family protein
MATALLRRAGMEINAKRVQRLWRQEGLKVPRRQRKRQRLGSKRERHPATAGRADQPGVELRLHL